MLHEQSQPSTSSKLTGGSHCETSAEMGNDESEKETPEPAWVATLFSNMTISHHTKRILRNSSPASHHSIGAFHPSCNKTSPHASSSLKVTPLPLYKLQKSHFFSNSWCGRQFLTKDLSPQALHSTHPHIIPTENHLGSPYHEKKDFQAFREKIAKHLPVNSLALIPANDKLIMTNDIPYTFRQNSDYFMAVGLHEPNGCLALEKISETETKEYLFIQPRSEETERWDGPRLGLERAAEVLGFKGEIQDVSNLEAFAMNRFLGGETLFVQVKNSSTITQKIVHQVLQQNKEKCIALDFIMDEVKKHKSEADVRMLKRAASISAHAIKQAIKNTKPGMSEAHIEAILEFESRMKGAQRLAYPPVIAGGSNSIVLHYVANNQQLKDGDLILIDAGCEYHLYPSDISRAWPINGKFTEPQRKLYTAILNAQKKLIEMCQPGKLSFNELHEASINLLAQEMIDFGIVNGVTQKEVVNNMQAFYPHMVGHPLGIDIHQNFDNGIKFEPGMVITVEPGLYIAARGTDPKDERIHDKCGVPEEFRGLGIRIEDNILITETGYENLTKETPKEIEEIESLMTESKDEYADRYECM